MTMALRKHEFQAKALHIYFQDIIPGPYERGWWGSDRNPLAGQIISKSWNFSPETVFTTLILASKLEFS